MRPPNITHHILSPAGPAPPLLLADELLGKLAVDIPDMRARVGVPDQVVYGGQGLTVTKLQLQVRRWPCGRPALGCR